MDQWLTIGDVAAATGESRDTIRYYERVGLVPKPPRTAAGYRRYQPGIVRRLTLIRNAQRFGFSLKEIAGFLGVRDRGGKPCHDVRAAAERMIVAVDRQIAELVATRTEMRRTLKTWDETLATTPPGRPAYLLERMTTGDVPAGRAAPRRAPASRRVVR
jgi:DNA-binding transcriptional MerR regulator